MLSKSDALEKFGADPLLMGRALLPTMYSVKSPPFHRELSDAYMDQTKTFVNVIAPRGHAKSSLVACVFVLHHLMHAKGVKVVVLVSKTGDHAVRLLESIKDVLNHNQRFRHYYGYWGEHSALQWRERSITLKDGSMLVAKGTGQQVVGLKHLNQRPTLIVLDDPEDMNNTKTVESMEFNLRWTLQQLVPSRDAARGRVFVIGTPQHQRCLVELLAQAAGWLTLRYKALNGPGPHTLDNKDLWALWPEQWPVGKLLAEKETAESLNRVAMWYREYQCEVISDETAVFREPDILYYAGHLEYDTKTHLHYLRLESRDGTAVGRKIPVTCFMGIDPATSISDNADYTVIMSLAVDSEGNRYVLPFIRARMKPSVVLETIQNEYHRWHPLKIRIEVSGQQEIYADVLRNLSDEYFTIVTHNPREKKSKRYLEGLEPYFVKHKIFILKEMTELKDELLAFRSDMRHLHDDMIDALWYANRGVYKPTHVVVEQSATNIGNRESRRQGWMTA